jgi:hypothetical protein
VNPRYPQVAARAGHRCEYCHAPESLFNFAFEVEHVTPAAAGGADAESNLALSCRSCNVHKSNRTQAIDPESLADVPLFDPRAARWDDHFRVDSETGRILGLTASGRATVAALAVNSDSQVAARRQWSRLGLFP